MLGGGEMLIPVSGVSGGMEGGGIKSWRVGWIRGSGRHTHHVNQ